MTSPHRLVLLLVAPLAASLACGSASRPPPAGPTVASPPAAPPQGAAAPTGSDAREPGAGSAPTSPTPPASVVRAERLPGLARFDLVSLLEADVLCGTRAGHAPVCASEERWADYARPYEALGDVVELEALNGVHCVLFGDGAARCAHEAAVASPPIGQPERGSLVARDVAALAVSGEAGRPLVFLLDRGGTLRVLRPPFEAPQPWYRVVAQGATSVAAVGSDGACVRLRDGGAACSPPGEPTAALQRVEGLSGVVAVHYGGALLTADGTWRYARPEAWRGYAPLPPRAVDYAPQALCVLVPGGGVRCGGLGRGWRDVELPAPARRFSPRGDALCAELVDDTTACWGPFLPALRRLSAAAERESGRTPRQR